MRTPLFEQHVRLGAKMTDFAGWDMPLQYSGISNEVLGVRTEIGLFDLSHMGEIVISGPSALESVQRTMTNDASRLREGQAHYTLLCTENGGVLDDLILYRIGGESYLAVVNAANTDTDLEWITAHAVHATEVRNRSVETAIIAVQGPRCAEVLSKLADFDTALTPRFSARYSKVSAVNCLASRTGYTGEDGFELLCDWDDAPTLWSNLLEMGELYGMQPAGLGARDVLRLESAYPLHGHELSVEITPVEARLMWVVRFDKGDFLGRHAIESKSATGPLTTLCGLEVTERCIPRHGHTILADDVQVGIVTSGTFSPTLRKPIALAYINREVVQTGADLQIIVRDRKCSVRITSTPFYKSEKISSGSAPQRRKSHAP